MSSGNFLIEDYSVGSTAPPLDFEWDGEDITGYTFDFEVKFENGQTKNLAVNVINTGDGVPGSVPAQFQFPITAGFWHVAGRHRGKLTYTTPVGDYVIPGFVFEVGDC